MAELKKCTCGKTPKVTENNPSSYFMLCECGRRTNSHNDAKAAEWAWNEGFVFNPIEEPTRYFVQIQLDTGEVFNCIKTASEIISSIDMQDCSGERMAVFMTTAFGTIVPLEVKGCWHDFNNPLLIECVDPDGNVVISGYGTDH